MFKCNIVLFVSYEFFSEDLTMDNERCAQDVLRCQLCGVPGLLLYCDFCQEHLCKLCVGEHISDESKDHKVVPFKKRGFTLKCQKHCSKLCDLYCEQCEIPICTLCISAKEHQMHDVVDILNKLESKKHELQKDLDELEKFIYPTYQKIVSTIPDQKADLKEQSLKLSKTIDRQGEDLHREIDLKIKLMKSDLEEIDSKHFKVLTNQEDEIQRTISEIAQKIADLKKLVNTNDVSLFSAYKSRNGEFRRFPPKLSVTLPRFTPQKINKEEIYSLMGSLSALTITEEEYDYTVNFPGTESSSTNKPLIDEPRIITDIKTEYGGSNGLRSLSCLNDENIWTCGCDKIMRLLNLKGEIVKSTLTKTGNDPKDITVTNARDLVYIDYHDKTVNIMKDAQIQELIKLAGWSPLSVCSTPSSKLLVIMRSDDKKQTRVARYSGSTETQIIQFNDNGQPLYTYGYIKYIKENKNLDICVSDHEAGAVVVVKETGKLRFTYTGSLSSSKKSFTPVGLSTDSQGRILIGDDDNYCIHILDQDGQFLRYIDNCQLHAIWGLCVGTRDNLFVAEFRSGRIKEIKYCA